MHFFVPFLLFFCFISSISGQSGSPSESDTIVPDIVYYLPTEVVVSTSRMEAPGTVSAVAQHRQDIKLLRPIQAQQSLQENLALFPGLYSQNANNHAQDLRISVRGFGARSAFGIRGIQLIVDGIPETTPDGQGQIDNLPIGLIESIGVSRGPASSFYGNASGGVIEINTLSQGGAPLGLSTTLSSFGFKKFQVSSLIDNGKTQFAGILDHSTGDGFRRHSRFENTVLNLKLSRRISLRSRLQFQFNYINSPEAQDPGGLNLADAQADRSAARQRNIDFKAGEAVRHWKTALLYRSSLSEHQDFQTYAFASGRQFDGRLPFEFGGWIDLDRLYYGHGSSFEHALNAADSPVNLHFKLGYELGVQRDDRSRFRNLMGVQGAQTLHQLEQFSKLGVYAVTSLTIRQFLVFGGLRQDWNWIAVDDRQSERQDRLQLNALSPSIGIRQGLSEQFHLFANYRSGFDTPSLSEIANNPNGSAGFNPQLGPQRSHNYELGAGIYLDKDRAFSLELVGFYVQVNDELTPYEIVQFPGRTFFRNAGKTSRVGLELASLISLSAAFKLDLSYTYMRARFRDFEVEGEQLAGNHLAGVPQHWASSRLSYAVPDQALTAAIQLRYNGPLYADNTNLTQVPTNTLIDLQAGYNFSLHTQRAARSLLLFAGINNLFSADYFDNIRINAFGGRYYEAGPGINFYGGIRLGI